MRRRYFSSRRAYAPRFWPMVVLAAAVASALAYLTDAGTTVAALIGGGVGIVVTQGRWVIWRRRHPMITHDQYIEDLRRAAPWN